MIQKITNDIRQLFKTISDDGELGIEKLPQSGGERMYFRLTQKGKSYIATYSSNLKESQTFFYFTDHFRNKNCPVTEIYAISDDKSIYIQKDFGSTSLLHIIDSEKGGESGIRLLKKSLAALAHMQIQGDKGLDYDQCITSKSFGKNAIMSDLLYFKYYFLDTLKVAYDKEKLLHDFTFLSDYLEDTPYKYFMYRDFQSRNIIIQNDEVCFIDYQGGMKGALQYDVASLLWQAKANLPEKQKEELLEFYINQVEINLGVALDKENFVQQYYGFVTIRLLQVLGAYGFRGIFERKAHFLTSIPLALHNLRNFLESNKFSIQLPELKRILLVVTEKNVIDRFEHVKASKGSPLVVTINSFSYKLGGIPKDPSPNGGGFVFDCRGILNPGRIDEYKTVNGRNKSVMEFLEQRTKMPDFLNAIYNVIDVTVEDYLSRGFESLMISFGCTGGCHRSVYAADAVAHYLRNKYLVKIKLNHIEQHISETKGF